MEELFYFTNAVIKLKHIAEITAQAGYKVAFNPSSRPKDELEAILSRKDLDLQDLGSLAVSANNREGLWLWYQMYEEEPDFQLFDSADWATLERLGYTSAFVVSFSPPTLRQLRQLLKVVLTAYGGWIGGDTPGFYPIYTIENIDDLTYPYLQHRSAP